MTTREISLDSQIVLVHMQLYHKLQIRCAQVSATIQPSVRSNRSVGTLHTERLISVILSQIKDRYPERCLELAKVIEGLDLRIYRQSYASAMDGFFFESGLDRPSKFSIEVLEHMLKAY